MSLVEPEDIGSKIALSKKLTPGEQITPFVTEILSFSGRVFNARKPCVLRRV